MAEAALALSEQKNQSLGEHVTRLKAEKDDEREKQSRLRKKEEEVGQQEQKKNVLLLVVVCELKIQAGEIWILSSDLDQLMEDPQR